jgi:SHS2 domain-containing protein
MSFEECPHTADVRIRAVAPTLELLFSDAFDALMLTLYGKDRTEGRIVKKICIEAPDTESLLLDFLSEVLYVSEVEGLVFSRAGITIRGGMLTAELEGGPFNRERHSAGTEVKGISWSGLSITHDTNGYMLDIIFDV